MKYKIVIRFSFIFLAALLLLAERASAQSVAYRQTNLASSLPNVANNVAPTLINPWGAAFLTGQPLFIADNGVGKVTALDATGLGVRPGSFTLPNAAGTGFDHPTGIVGDQNSAFGNPSLIQPFIIATDEGAIFTWGVDAQGDLPPQATLQFSRASAVFKGAAILNSPTNGPVLAATDFQAGFVEAFRPFNPGFTPVVLPGAFADPTLPPGYAPFGIQVIGKQVFVTYALQDALKHDPIFGAGNGVVNIFDTDGNFVKRFVMGGALNAPWGMTQAGANFGPFSNDILIGNVGDGTINAFDPASGNFVGQLKDGDGNAIANSNLHGLLFGSAAFGDPNALYFTAGINDGQDGLFGAITTGLVSTTRISAPLAQIDTPTAISVTVSAGPSNRGTPTGSVTIQDGDTVLATPPLVNGAASFNALFSNQGSHAIKALYSGDAAFLASSAQMEVQATGFPTTLTLAAQANVDPGSVVILTATLSSPDGFPPGEVSFLEGSTSLGTATADLSGVALLQLNTLAAGSHTITASFAGSLKFAPSVSAAVTVQLANPDFSLSPASANATVTAGQPAQFTLTLTPMNGFASRVGFSCAAPAGVTCTFNPPTVEPARGAAVSTSLTVTTSARAANVGLLPDGIDPRLLLALLALCTLGVLFRQFTKLERKRVSLLTATAMLALAGIATLAAGCGGYGGNGGKPSTQNLLSIVVTAQSGSVSHTSTLNITVQ